MEQKLSATIKKAKFAIAIDLTSLCRPITGTERVALELTKELVKNEEIHFYLFFRKGVHADFLVPRGNVTTIVSPFQSQLLTEQIWMPYIVVRTKPQLTHFPFFPPGLFFRHPFVITVHDANLWLNSKLLSWKTRLYTKPLVELALRNAELIFLTNDQFLDDFIRCSGVDRHRISVTGIGISSMFGARSDSEKIGDVRKKYRLNPDFLLSVGTIEPRKNYENLIRAVGSLREWFIRSGWQLVLVGRPAWGYDSVVAEIDKLQLHDQILLVGHVPDEDLIALYSMANSFVLTSQYEGFGLPVFEAMASGLPVVCSKIPPFTALLNDAVVFIDPLDVQSIARGILMIAENHHLRSSLIAHGLEVSRRNSWPAVAQNVIRSYIKLAGPSQKDEHHTERLDLVTNHRLVSVSKIDLLGARVLRIRFGELVELIKQLIVESTASHLVITTNADHLYKINNDEYFRKIYDETPIIVADGVPLLWASRLLGKPLPERINGTDLMEHLCGVAERHGYGIFLVGGHDRVAERCAEFLRKHHPKLNVLGAISPSDNFLFPSKECDDVVDKVSNAKPDILFVGFGAPKQEKWIYEYKQRMGVPICIGVGVSFSFISGELRRAPLLFQRAGLEWLWRFFLEPRRLFVRYAVSNTYFVWRVLMQLLQKIVRASNPNH